MIENISISKETTGLGSNDAEHPLLDPEGCCTQLSDSRVNISIFQLGIGVYNYGYTQNYDGRSSGSETKAKQ